MAGRFNPHRLSAQAVQTELEVAVASGIGSRGPKVYKKISAVLMHFEDDDIGCDGPENELAETFQRFYNIHNIKRVLFKNNHHPGLHLGGVFSDLDDKGYLDIGCLVILVFSGHGQLQQGVDQQHRPTYSLKLGGALGPNGKFRTRPLDWVQATTNLGTSNCDVLHILDCCCAAEAMSANAELLAASTETASSDDNVCFTRAISYELRRLSSTPFTISTLYQTLLNNRRALKLEHIPFYRKRSGHDSIVLGGHKGRSVVPTLKPTDKRVLLAVHVDKNFDAQDLRDWKEWLNDLLPSSVMGMQIALDGAWDSSSSIMLLSVPITVWAQLDMPFVFIGEVTSNNKLLEQATTTLAIRPLQGIENRKPGESSKKPLQGTEDQKPGEFSRKK